jgi:hypothetical protein
MPLIPPCSEVQANLTEYLEGSLSLRQRLGIRLHLLVCRGCDCLRKALELLPRLGRQVLEAPGQAPPEAERVLEAFLKHLPPRGTAPTDGAPRTHS